jgi:hypothetical protein
MLNIFKFRNGLNIIPRPDGATAPNSQGDLAVSSADGKLYYNNGTVTVALVGESTSSTITNKVIVISGPGANIFSDGTDSTKQIALSASGATTGTILTLADNQSTSQILNFPNITATDTLVTNNFPATLTNKTISGASNTLTNIPTSALTGTVSLINGGTGVAAASANAAFDALSPMTTAGDIIYENATPTATNLPIGTTGQVLTVASGLPAWQTPSPGFTNPMTSVGDIIVGGAGGAATRLAATSNGYILTLVSGTPAWVANSGGAAPTSIGTLDGQSPNAMGLTIASSVLYAQSASATVPGMVNTGTQTFSGAKTFVTSISTPVISDTGSGLTISSSSGHNINISPGSGGTTVVSSPLTLQEISTPSNPPSGFIDFYSKSDGNLYYLNSSGLETLVGPGISGTNWDNSLSFTTSNFGTISNSQIYSRRVGDTLEVRGYFNIGTASAAPGAIVLPSGYNMDTTKMGSSSDLEILGRGHSFDSGGSQIYTSSYGLTLFYDGSSTTNIFFSYLEGSDAFAKANGANIGSGNVLTFEFKVPIAGWTVNNGSGGSSYTFAHSLVNTGGTVTLVGDTASPGASEYYGTNGSSVLGYYALPSGTISGLATDGVVYATSATTVASTAVGTAGQVLTSNGTGLAPTFQASGGGNPFDYFASSQVTSNSTSITSTTFTTFSNSPAFTFTPNFTGKYKVYSIAYLTSTGTSLGSYCQITNTSGGATLLNAQSASMKGSNSTVDVSVYTQSVYSLTASTSYVFDIQGKVDSGGGVSLVTSIVPFTMFAERIG